MIGIPNARRLLVLSWLLAGAAPLVAGAQAPAPVAVGQSEVNGPPPPVPPSVISRDGRGKATVRAVGLDAPLRIDGRLDEAVYATTPSMSDFIQTEPVEGVPATQQTEVWVFFDDKNIYVVGRCWEAHPERMIANEMRRDGSGVTQNDNFAWSFDTFLDRRNAILFEVTPVGGRVDVQITDERVVNRDWNPVWEVATGRFEGGWTVEAAIPFKSLRYRPGTAQTWGFQSRRKNLWKNEVWYLTRIPAAMGTQGHFRSSMSATMVGLQVPSGAKNIDIKPYAITDLNSDTTSRPPTSNDIGADAGVDVKYGITRNLTADFTYNTDFAQVEADEQQINLTRFSLFFPEKREFFLENQGTFGFGGLSTAGEVPMLFYSRSIGLHQGRVVPISAGGRVTGQIGRFSLGILTIGTRTDEASGAPATNFTVARVKRDIFRKSSVGLMFTGRSVTRSGLGANQAFGMDGAFGFFDNLSLNTYWARTVTDGASDGADSYRAQLDYVGDRYGVMAEHLMVGDAFNPEAGFVQRTDMRKSFGQFRFSPRLRSHKTIRKISTVGALTYIENTQGRLETHKGDGSFTVDFHNGDQAAASYQHTYDALPAPFRVATGVVIPVGSYSFGSTRVGFTGGRQRKISGNVFAEHGSFYSGTKTTFGVATARFNPHYQLSFEPLASINRVHLVEGSFTSSVIGSRVTYTMTPLMFVSALVQYNSGTTSVSSNVRFRWEYAPGSELFVVYNDQRDTRVDGFPGLLNRAFVVKINRLVRF